MWLGQRRERERSQRKHTHTNTNALYLDGRLGQRVARPLAVAVHVALEVGREVLEDEVQHLLLVLLHVLHTQQPFGWLVFLVWVC